MALPQLIERLRQAVAEEHAAIVQYLHHAYALEATPYGTKLEGLAREEMFHFKWLNEALVRLGHEPYLGRGPVDKDRTATAAALLTIDAADEERAAASYQELADSAVEYPWLQTLLRRLAQDESRHHQKLAAMIAALGDQPLDLVECGSPALGGCPHQGDVAMLNRDVQAEYDTILEFLDRIFRTGDARAQNLFMDQAVDSMRHLGWLSELVAEMGGDPAIDVLNCDPRSGDTLVEWLAAQSAGEDTIHAMYAEHIRQLENPEARALLERVLAQEVGHCEHLKDLMEQLRQRGVATRPGAGAFTVGSLIRKQ